jgi:hypothetical protein
MADSAVLAAPLAPADLFVIGVAADLAGAVALAWSFVVKDASAVAREVMLPLRTYDGLAKGFTVFARSIARQRAEAHVGAALLVVGF